LRSKRRYVLLEYTGEGEASAEEVLSKVRLLVAKLFGLVGLADVNPDLVYSWGGKVFVVAVRREGLEKLLASLVLDRSYSMKILSVTGSLRRAKKLIASMRK